VALAVFVRRRKDLAFHGIFWMFAAFILACGTTHLIGVWDLYRPLYKIDGLVKLATGCISVATAAMLWPLIPKALALPSPAELERRVVQRTAELAESNAALRDEIAARAAMEQEREQLLARERAARNEAERVNRMKDEFLATLSHELRTPLNAILGWSGLLMRGELEEGEVREGVTIIERNARAQVRLIEDLLDMSRIISGKMRLDVQPVDLHEVVAAAVQTVLPAASAKGIRVQRVLDPRAGPVTGDPARLQQVSWNLLANAVKFTPRGGAVQLTLERVNSHVELSVADNGPGIAPEFLPFVFEPFRQADASTTRQHGGLGLGLAICRRIAELHGGTIRAQSPGLGQGATFTVSLPLRAARLPELPAERMHPERSRVRSDADGVDLRGLRLVVVDDEPDARELLRRILEEVGAEVLVAGSAPEAIALVADERPHVLLCDIGLPDEDGYSLLRRLRQLPAARGGRTPAIAVTAFARAEDRTRAMRAGFQNYVSKPFEPAELVATVANRVGRAGPGAVST
jgi:signal transduction histidine kinase/ActR/RegA family two-component response regulator